MAKKKPKHYCNNNDLLTELIKYHNTNVMSDELGVMFINISRRLTGHSYFRHYEDIVKDELVGSAIVRMVEQIDMFDVNICKYELNDVVIKTSIKQDEIIILKVAGKTNRKVNTQFIRHEYELVNMTNDEHRIPLSKPNPFAYFTQIAWNCFVLECRRHYKQKNIKRKIAIDCFTNMESNVNYKIDAQLYDIMKEMIGDDDHYTKQRKMKLDSKKKKVIL